MAFHVACPNLTRQVAILAGYCLVTGCYHKPCHISPHILISSPDHPLLVLYTLCPSLSSHPISSHILPSFSSSCWQTYKTSGTIIPHNTFLSRPPSPCNLAPPFHHTLPSHFLTLPHPPSHPPAGKLTRCQKVESVVLGNDEPTFTVILLYA